MLSPRPVEIRHGKQYDVVVNRRHPKQELVQYAAEQLRDGIPPSWHRLEAQMWRRRYVDSPERPRLFAKTRLGINASQYNVRQDQVDATGSNIEDIDGERARIRAEHSVLSEMQIAVRVREALKEEAVQEAVRRNGFAGLSLVEPLVAISDKRTGEKTVVYPWQEGVPVEDPWTGAPAISESVVDGVDEVIFVLDGILSRQGIVSHDHTPSQYLIQVNERGKYYLYLPDIERFTSQVTT